MRVGLNLLHARPEIGGGWNYIANLVGTLRLMDCDWEFVAYCTRISAEIVPDDPRFKVKIVHLGGSSQIARVVYEQCILPFLAYRDKVNCIHWFANNISLLGLVPSVVTIYDFKYNDRPDEGSPAKRLYLRNMMRFACERADTLAPMSEATAEAAIRLFGIDRQRIYVVTNPIDDMFYPALFEEVREFRERFKLPPQFWLYVAHPYPHKNHIRLFAAYKRFRETSHCLWPLVLRGDRSKGDEKLDIALSDLGISEAVIWLPRLSSEDMARLYSSATAMIFPSLYEGCGIPILEAMACGCPVVASDISTTKEFAGDAALMFDASSVEAISAAMHHFTDYPQLRESYVAKGYIKSKQYSSANVAVKLLAAYKNAVPSGRRNH